MEVVEFNSLLEGKILDFPDSRQSVSFSCGASALQSVLVYYGYDILEKEIMKNIGTDERGSPVLNMKKYIESFDLKYEEGTFDVKDLKKFIDKDVPVIVLIQAWSEILDKDYSEDWEDGHYVVAIGYDDENIIFDDPSIHSRRGYIPMKEFEKRWHDVDVDETTQYKNWGIAIYGKPVRFKSKERLKVESRF